MEKQNFKECSKIIREIILNSKSYSNYLIEITDDIYKYFSSLDIKDSKYYEMAFRDLNFMETFSSEVLQNSKKFNKVMHDSMEEDKNVLKKIICRKYLETYIGNENKEDLNEIDVLFPILEVIFDLDTLLASVKNQNILAEKFEELNNENIYDFYNIFDLLYRECNGKSYEDMIEIVRNNSESIRPYVTNGMVVKINEIEKDNRKSYSELNDLFSRVTYIIGSKNKIM